MVVGPRGLVGTLLGPSCGVLKASWALWKPSETVLERSWAVLGPSWVSLGPIGVILRGILQSLGQSWGPSGRNWGLPELLIEALLNNIGVLFSRLGALLAVSRAALERSGKPLEQT